MRIFWSAILGSVLATGCSVAPSSKELSVCAEAPMIGLFDPSHDVFVGHFDSKPDVDDLHTIAAVGSLLKQDKFACVDAVAVAGAYGTQGGEYIHSPDLFDLAFRDKWLDGHNDREGTIEAQAELFIDTISDGGDVWIMIAGQADIAADALEIAVERAPDLPYKSKLHLIQHSDWNESVTAPHKLAFVQENADYQKIADGNARGNGTPGFTTSNGELWSRVLADPRIGQMWGEAKRLADEQNPSSAYVNPSVASGGFDFSDTSEMAHVFGLNVLDNVPLFFDHVLQDTQTVWPNGAKAAVALTYDDALLSQVETALPQLDEVGLKATFYLSLASQGYQAHQDVWRRAALNGHELGNHTIYHPCRASLPNRDWVASNRDLDTYTKDQLLRELEDVNVTLGELDQEQTRTFAYTCGDVRVGGEPFVEDLEGLFPGARSVERDVAFASYYVPSFAVDETPAAEMIEYVDGLIERGAIGSFTFHGVGGDHLWVTPEDHAALLAHLKSVEDQIWVAPLRDILEWRSQTVVANN